MPYMTQNLIQRGHTWYVRYIVPTAWRDAVGRREVVRTLGTRDLDEARRKKHKVLASIIAECQQLADPSAARAIVQSIKNADHQETLSEVVDLHIDELAFSQGDEVARAYAKVFSGQSMPISKASEKWLDRLKATGRVTAGTIDGRRHAVGTFIKAMGDKPMSEITPKVALEWLEKHLEKSGRSPKTLGRYISAMGLLWEFSRAREWCEGPSPFAGLTKELSKAKATKRAFKDDELNTFLKGLAAKRNKHPEEYDVGVLLIESGCRLNEIAELRVRDVFDGGEVHIHDGKTRAANRVVFFLSDRAQAILKRRTAGKESDDQVFEELTPGGQDEKLGHSLSKRMRRTLAEVIPQAKEQGLDLHSIRRWAATVLDNLENVDRTLKSQVMGHKAGDMLGDIYSNGPEKARVKKVFVEFSTDALKRVPG